MGLDPASGEARHALARVRDRVTWADCGPEETQHNTYFEGEIEPCIYDVLRGLDYQRRAGVTPDERVGEAVALLESKRDTDGRWRPTAWIPPSSPPAIPTTTTIGDRHDAALIGIAVAPDGKSEGGAARCVAFMPQSVCEPCSGNASTQGATTR